MQAMTRITEAHRQMSEPYPAARDGEAGHQARPAELEPAVDRIGPANEDAAEPTPTPELVVGKLAARMWFRGFVWGLLIGLLFMGLLCGVVAFLI